MCSSTLLYPENRNYVMTSLASLALFKLCPWLDLLAMDARLEARLRLPDFFRPGILGPAGRWPERLVTAR